MFVNLSISSLGIFDLSCSVGGGGGNLIGLTYGDMPLFRGTFFPKNAELWVSVFNYVRNYGYHLKKYINYRYHFGKPVS